MTCAPFVATCCDSAEIEDSQLMNTEREKHMVLSTFSLRKLSLFGLLLRENV